MRVAELPRPRPRHRIVERDDEAGAGRGIEPPLDQVPGLEIVGQRQRAEIVAERRADPRRDREHGGNAGNENDIERAPASGPVSISSQTAAAMANTPGSPPETTATLRALRGVTQRGGGARAFLAVVGGMAALAGARRHAVEIGPVAVERLARRASASAASGVR